LLMVTDVGSLSILLAAHCTYMSVIDPAQVVHISDFHLTSKGGCNFPVITTIRIQDSTNYLTVLAAIYKSKVPLHPWVLIGSEPPINFIKLYLIILNSLCDSNVFYYTVKPWTFLHPRRLTAYVAKLDPSSKEIYVGKVRNATSELSALGQMPQ